MNPTIAVIIPTVPGRRPLTPSFQSIVDAGMSPNDQVVVAFDGDVCCQAARAYRSAVSFVDWPAPPDQIIASTVVADGPSNDWGSKARTQAASLVRTDWVVYLDDDDVLDPAAFATWRAALGEVAKADWRPRHFRVQVNDGSVVHGDHRLGMGNVSTLGIAVRSGLAKAVAWPGTRYENDFDFLAQAAAAGWLGPSLTFADGNVVFVDNEVPVARARMAGTRSGAAAFVRDLVAALDADVRPEDAGGLNRVMTRDRLVATAADLVHVARPALIGPALFPAGQWIDWPGLDPIWPWDRRPDTSRDAIDGPGNGLEGAQDAIPGDSTTGGSEHA